MVLYSIISTPEESSQPLFVITLRLSLQCRNKRKGSGAWQVHILRAAHRGPLMAFRDWEMFVQLGDFSSFCGGRHIISYYDIYETEG